MKIDPEYKLPCDFIVGHIHFRKGVALETVRQAAERWHAVATANFKASPRYKLDDLLKGISADGYPANPRNVSDWVWFYEEKKGIVIIVQPRAKPRKGQKLGELLFAMPAFTIPWRKVEAAVDRRRALKKR